MKRKRKLADVIGDRHGRLTIIADVPKVRPRRVIARCDCGNEKDFRLDALRTGDTQSCGCKTRMIDETGNRYGKLTVIKTAGVGTQGKYLFECKCDCGNTIITQGFYLRNGDTTSCGCAKLKQDRTNFRDKLKEGYVDGFNTYHAKRKVGTNNTSGVKGVAPKYTKSGTKWQAYIGYKGKQIQLGTFKNKEDAIAARLDAEEKYYKPHFKK